MFLNGAPPGEETAVNDGEKPQTYQEKEQRRGSDQNKDLQLRPSTSPSLLCSELEKFLSVGCF